MFTNKLVDDNDRKNIRLWSLAFGSDNLSCDQLIKASHTYETERAIAHSFSQAAAIGNPSSSQSSQRLIKKEYRRSRSRDYSESANVSRKHTTCSFRVSGVPFGSLVVLFTVLAICLASSNTTVSVARIEHGLVERRRTRNESRVRLRNKRCT